MATTLKAIVYADTRRRDGTYNVKIRVTHNRRSLKVSTNIYVSAKDLTKGLKIKNGDITEQVDALVQAWRGIVNRLGRTAETMNVKQVVEHLKRVETNGDAFNLDFIQYGRQVAALKSKGTGGNYNIALNAFCRFLKRDTIDIGEITPNLLTEFENFIENEPVLRGDAKTGTALTSKSKTGGRAASLYLGCLRHIHNCAKEKFNDEDRGVISVSQSPFKKYKLKKQPKAKRRAIPVKNIQAILNLPDYKGVAGSVTEFPRRDLARDCFILSFALAGMNAADLYDCPAQVLDDDEPVIIYKRKKTRTRRDDEAEMHIRIEPCIAPLIERYKDPSGERFFCFHKKYSTAGVFNSALRRGLQMVEEAIKAKKHFTFYSARHSYATISRSKALNIDKYTIHEGLNHVDPKMKITDGYIERDYSNIWDANAKLLALFNWSKLELREILR